MWRRVQFMAAVCLIAVVAPACSAGTEPTGELLISAGDDVDTWVARVDIETGEVERVTDWGLAGSGRWSPDGETIAAAGWSPSNVMAVHTINSDGSVTVLTEDRDNALPAWAPDCQRLAFVRVESVTLDIWIMDADGSNRARVTDHGSTATGPDWSPDGQRIVFHSDLNGGNPELYSVRPDGGDEVRLTTNNVADAFPNWSSDGQRIVFQQSTPERSDVVVIDADGSNAKVLTVGEVGGQSPVWSPDGEWIAYQRTDGQLGVIRADGSDERLLTTAVEVNGYPTDWGPHEGICVVDGGTG